MVGEHLKVLAMPAHSHRMVLLVPAVSCCAHHLIFAHWYVASTCGVSLSIDFHFLCPVQLCFMPLLHTGQCIHKLII